MKRIYLDWNATAPTHPQVVAAMSHTLANSFGNPSSIHQDGQRARSIIELARRAVAKTTGAAAQGVVFFSSATEANNTVIRSAIADFDSPILVTSRLEHPSVYYLADELAHHGTSLRFISTDRDGVLTVDNLADATSDGCNLLSCMFANNELGNINNIKALADFLKSDFPNALLHVDATQAFGRIPIDFNDLGADIVTLGFHKCGGPKGIAVALLREGVSLKPLLFGGQQERGRHPGTENTVAAAGVSTICKLVDQFLPQWIEHSETLKQHMIQRLSPCNSISRVGDPLHSLPNTLNYRFHGVQQEDMLLALDLEGVSLSAGSACSAGSIEPSHVLTGLGFSIPEAKESLRISFGYSTTIEEIDSAATKILQSYERIKSLNS